MTKAYNRYNMNVFLKRNTNGNAMNTRLTEYLKSFGLTGQEATIYEALLVNGEMTGYEMAKETGISRSYVYGALSALVDKGAAYLIEGDSARYTAVSVDRFCDNTLHDLGEKAEYLKAHAPVRKETCDGYISIQGTPHIHNKIHDMLDKCEKRLYFMASAEIVGEYTGQLKELIQSGKKVVIMSTEEANIKGCSFYETEPEPYQVRLITDSRYVLTGTYGDENDDTCLYSGQPNLVKVMKEALGNRISLIEMEEKER